MTKNEIDFSAIELVNRLPAVYRADESRPFRSDLTGATIVRIGAPADPRLVEGGGLVVDYLPQGSSQVLRLVLSLTELGAEVEYQGPCEACPTQASPPE